jgi:hypothetical protein
MHLRPQVPEEAMTDDFRVNEGPAEEHLGKGGDVERFVPDMGLSRGDRGRVMWGKSCVCVSAVVDRVHYYTTTLQTPPPQY